MEPVWAEAMLGFPCRDLIPEVLPRSYLPPASFFGMLTLGIEGLFLRCMLFFRDGVSLCFFGFSHGCLISLHRIPHLTREGNLVLLFPASNGLSEGAAQTDSLISYFPAGLKILLSQY